MEEKAELMRKLGKKQLTLHLQNPLHRIPLELAAYNLTLAGDGSELIYTYDSQIESTGIAAFLKDLNEAGIVFKDLRTTQSSLEDTGTMYELLSAPVSYFETMNSFSPIFYLSSTRTPLN